MISVICPVYNEVQYIENLLNFFICSDPKEKELLVIDGNSNDGTTEVIKRWAEKHNNIFLIENPDKYVPQGLNKAIRLCKGDIIIRLDGHSEYETDYFQKIVETFSTVDTDIVGGPMRTKGVNNFQKAVAYATCTKMAVGNSHFHNPNYQSYSDHVYLGSWYKELFNEIGFFDERLRVDHDEDFSYRARSMGKKIFINPNIKSYYYPRASFPQLFKQYFRYGFEKPMVFFNVPTQIKFRHLIPSVFSVYLISLPLFYNYWILIFPLTLYFLLILIFSLKNSGNIMERIYTVVVYPIIHISYGIGVLTGFLNFKGLFKKP